MDFFGRPDIEKMVSENDREGLYHCLDHRDLTTRLQAARALAILGDGAGWRVLSEWVVEPDDPDLQEGAAVILGELGSRSPGDAHRAVGPLGAALKEARDVTAEIIRDSLLAIGGSESEQALRDAGFTPSIEEETGDISEYEAHFVRPFLPDTSEVQFLSAEAHLNTAVDLREADLAERALVECSLALWLKPDWAYAWYLRGVIFDDLDRFYEALLAYQHALELEPDLAEAEEAYQDLLDGSGSSPFFKLDDPVRPGLDQALSQAGSLTWQDRRDAAAALGTVSSTQDALKNLLNEDEREIRSAAIFSLGEKGGDDVPDILASMSETSWLLRFQIIEALAKLGSVDGLVSVLEREMENLMNRNPTFSSHKDPMVEVEYERLFEIGVRSLERTNNMIALVEIVEGNAWIEDEEEPGSDNSSSDDEEIDNDLINADEEYDLEAEEDLSLYVDEVAQMACIALEQAAVPRIAQFDPSLLQRLAVIPDLTLIDMDQMALDTGEEEPPTSVVVDLTALRNAASSELRKRGVSPS